MSLQKTNSGRRFRSLLLCPLSRFVRANLAVQQCAQSANLGGQRVRWLAVMSNAVGGLDALEVTAAGTVELHEAGLGHPNALEQTFM